MVTVREVCWDDLDAVLQLRLEFLADNRKVPSESFTAEFRRATRDFLERRMAGGTMRSWLAERDGRCVGVVSLLLLEMAPRLEDDRSAEGYVINMYVLPEHRHVGVGRALFAACLDGARGLGVRKLLLHATADGRPLYEAFDFRSNEDFMELRLDR